MKQSADLNHTLQVSFRTVASVNSQRASQQCIEAATKFWLDKYRTSYWTIITVDLTLLTNILESKGTNHIATKNLGILQRYSLNTYQQDHTLFVYSTDRYTENWVHELINSTALHSPASNRVLNVQRDDSGPILDLGPLTA